MNSYDRVLDAAEWFFAIAAVTTAIILTATSVYVTIAEWIGP